MDDSGELTTKLTSTAFPPSPTSTPSDDHNSVRLRPPSPRDRLVSDAISFDDDDGRTRRIGSVDLASC